MPNKTLLIQLKVLVEVVVALQRLRELAVQAANDTNSAVDRGFIQVEAQQLISEINRIGSTTKWNGMNVLDGFCQ